MIELRHIGKTFPGVRALNDVSLQIQPGEVLGLVGENGAGKSTLIKILGGVYRYGTYTGDVMIGGRPARFRGITDARLAGIAVVHQELSLVPGMTVAENLVLGREPSRFGVVDAARARKLAADIAGIVIDDPSAILDTPVSELGIGVQQLLEIARALSERAKVIVLDEPTAALTEGETQRLFQLIRARRDTTSFVYISHRLEEIAQMCDRVAVLRDGQLVEIVGGRASNLVELMTGKELVESTPPRLASDAATVLDVRGLTVDGAIRDVSFTVRAGEVVALAGAMGSGRTATLSALFGLARTETSGTVSVDGRPLLTGTATSPRAAIAAGFALVPEDRKAAGVVLGMGVADNLALAALDKLASRLGLVDPGRVEHHAVGKVRELGIKIPGLHAEAGTLSGGNQQKIVIAKWLERAPRVLLLDEPTRGVDVGAKAEIYALIEQLTAKGHAVVIASSDLPEVVRLAHRVLVMREGRVAGVLDRSTLTQLAIMNLAVGAHPHV